MGFRTTMKCPQKVKKKVWIVQDCKGLSEIFTKQCYSQPKILHKSIKLQRIIWFGIWIWIY